MQIETFAVSDIGLKRENNEDRYLVDHDLKLLAISDGMGGHAAGEVAATRSLEIAVEYVREHAPVVKIAHTSPDGYFRVLQLAEHAMKSVFLFRGLSLSRLTRVMNIAAIEDYGPGQMVISKGDECEGIYVVLSGRFSVASDSGKTEELATGQSFGAASLLHQQESRATITAREASQMMYISGPDFDRLTQRQPKLGQRLLRRLSQHLSEELHRLAVDDFNLSDTGEWESTDLV